MTEGDASTPKRTIRKAETPAQRLQRLQAEVEMARSAARDYEQRIMAVMAGAMIAEAKERPELMAMMREALDRRMPNKAELASAMELLDQRAAARKRKAA